MMASMPPIPALFALLVGCDQLGADSGDPATDTDTASGVFTDADEDGYPDWRGTDDPLVADCDDGDPTITPKVEVYVPAGPFTRGQVGLEHAEPLGETHQQQRPKKAQVAHVDCSNHANG